MAALVAGVAALVLFFLAVASVPLAFGATVTGITALWRLRAQPGRSGRAMAAIGIASGFVGVILAVAFIVLLPDDKLHFEALTVPYARLNLGDCYQRPLRLDRAVEVVSCGQEHDRQAIGAVEHPAPAGAHYPGDAALEAFAAEQCRAASTRYVDLPDEQAGLVAANQVPTAVIWADGSRHVVCAVERRDGSPLTGSVTDNSALFPQATSTPR